jgi:nicotinamide mononucleotide adenylyltransferase
MIPLHESICVEGPINSLKANEYRFSRLRIVTLEHYNVRNITICHLHSYRRPIPHVYTRDCFSTRLSSQSISSSQQGKELHASSAFVLVLGACNVNHT